MIESLQEWLALFLKANNSGEAEWDTLSYIHKSFQTLSYTYLVNIPGSRNFGISSIQQINTYQTSTV